MATLFLLAPYSRNQPATNHKDFYDILAKRVGPDYGISSSLIKQVSVGMHVVVFDRERQLRAEGVVSGYRETSKAGNGVQRYDVTIHGLAVQKQYRSPPTVNRFGVAIY